jgi:hypothetical protein
MSVSQLDQERETQQEYAQEVLRQIQSFGEAADDEFDVQWATSMTKKDAAKEPEEQPVEKPEEQEQVIEEQKQAPQARINPFLDSPEEEEADSVTVEQVVSFVSPYSRFIYLDRITWIEIFFAYLIGF